MELRYKFKRFARQARITSMTVRAIEAEENIPVKLDEAGEGYYVEADIKKYRAFNEKHKDARREARILAGIAPGPVPRKTRGVSTYSPQTGGRSNSELMQSIRLVVPRSLWEPYRDNCEANQQKPLATLRDWIGQFNEHCEDGKK